MKNIVLSIGLTILFSLMYFQVEFHALPGINTKMMIASLGLVTFCINVLISREKCVSRLMFGVFFISLLFSLISFVSVVYNGTDDLVYATYFSKMSVWLFASYFVMSAIKWVHGRVTFQLLFHYMALLCAAQCIIALLIDNIPALYEWLKNTIVDNYEFIERNKRLIGIGAMYDTAGIRFTPVLIGLMYLMINKRSNKQLFFYMILWTIIVVIGSAMSRTTSIGAIVSLFYLLFNKISFGQVISYKAMKIFVGAVFFAVVVIVIVVYCYNNVPEFRGYMEFGFQNFFNYSRSGDFTSQSTRNLLNMFILPDNLKTWIIGDALFDVPGGFYMSTDIGYLRFIFYCGLIGFSTFISLFVFCTIELSRIWPKLKGLFIAFLIWQAIAWIKNSTDIFVIFALLALVPLDKGDRFEPIYHKRENI